jgi:hypothetical protein
MTDEINLPPAGLAGDYARDCPAYDVHDLRNAILADRAQQSPQAKAQLDVDELWRYAQLYADEHRAEAHPHASLAGIEGAKRRKLTHEVALRHGLRALAEKAARPVAPAPAQPPAQAAPAPR